MKMSQVANNKQLNENHQQTKEIVIENWQPY